MKDELGGQIMKEFVGLRAKTYSYLIDDHNENKKAKGTKKWVIKREIRFQDYLDLILIILHKQAYSLIFECFSFLMLINFL